MRRVGVSRSFSQENANISGNAAAEDKMASRPVSFTSPSLAAFEPNPLAPSLHKPIHPKFNFNFNLLSTFLPRHTAANSRKTPSPPNVIICFHV